MMIAFNPVLKRITNSTTAALLLSYFIQHCKTTQTSEKFHKSQKELESETGLSRTEQENARKTLKALGLLKEERAGIPCRLYFEVNVEAVYKLTSDDSLLPLLQPNDSNSNKTQDPENLKNTQIFQFAGTLQTRLQESYKQVCGYPAIKIAANLQTSLQTSCNQDCGNPADKCDTDNVDNKVDNEVDNENMRKHANFPVCRNPANKIAENLQTSMQETCNQDCGEPADYARTRAHARAHAHAYTYTLSNSSSISHLTWYYREITGNTTNVEFSLSSPSSYLQTSSLSSPSFLPKALLSNAFGMDASEKISRSETSDALVSNNAAGGESAAESAVKSVDEVGVEGKSEADGNGTDGNGTDGNGVDGKPEFVASGVSDGVSDPVQADPVQAQPEPEQAALEPCSAAESGTLDGSDKEGGVSEVLVELDHTHLDLSCESETLQKTGGGRAEDALQSDGRAEAAENAHKSLITHELFEDIPNIVHSGENAIASPENALKQKRGAGRKAKSEDEAKKARKARRETEEEKAFRQEFFAFATKAVDWIVSRGGVREDPACFYRWAKRLAKNDSRITVEVIRACFRHYAMQTNGYGWRGKLKTFKQFMYAFNEIYQHYQASLNLLKNQNLNGGHHDLSTSRSESQQPTRQQSGNESTTAVARSGDVSSTGSGETTQLLGDINTAGYDYLEWREKYERELREYEQKLKATRELCNSPEFIKKFSKW